VGVCVFLCKKNRLSPVEPHLLKFLFALVPDQHQKYLFHTSHTKGNPRQIQPHARSKRITQRRAKKRKRRAKASLWFENPRALLPFCRYLSKKRLK
jgi:hypothetical protein